MIASAACFVGRSAKWVTRWGRVRRHIDAIFLRRLFVLVYRCVGHPTNSVPTGTVTFGDRVENDTVFIFCKVQVHPDLYLLLGTLAKETFPSCSSYSERRLQGIPSSDVSPLDFNCRFSISKQKYAIVSATPVGHSQHFGFRRPGRRNRYRHGRPRESTIIPAHNTSGALHIRLGKKSREHVNHVAVRRDSVSSGPRTSNLKTSNQNPDKSQTLHSLQAPHRKRLRLYDSSGVGMVQGFRVESKANTVPGVVGCSYFQCE